jgi:hypothetical protein
MIACALGVGDTPCSARLQLEAEIERLQAEIKELRIEIKELNYRGGLSWGEETG